MLKICNGNNVTAYLECQSNFWLLHVVCGGEDVGAFPDPTIGLYSCEPFAAVYPTINWSPFNSGLCVAAGTIISAVVTE